MERHCGPGRPLVLLYRMFAEMILQDAHSVGMEIETAVQC